jgi:hypothetical protein
MGQKRSASAEPNGPRTGFQTKRGRRFLRWPRVVDRLLVLLVRQDPDRQNQLAFTNP